MAIEVAIEDAKQIFGAGQARNRLAAAVHRTVPFTLARQSLGMLWYATAGHHPGDVDEHRARAPWYRTKAEPSTADMIAKLRRVLIAAKYRPVHPGEPKQKSTPFSSPGPSHNCESRGVMSTLRNLAISLLRLFGFDKPRHAAKSDGATTPSPSTSSECEICHNQTMITRL